MNRTLIGVPVITILNRFSSVFRAISASIGNGLNAMRQKGDEKGPIR
ncbi:hypothetical protein ACMA5I_05170 [Paracoccaceae bacterium GXU_MW_L88]